MKKIHVLMIAAFVANNSYSEPWPDLVRPLDFLDFSHAQRLEDLRVLTSSIEEYYAPLEYKEARFGFRWSDLKTEYEQKLNNEVSTREQFVALVQHFVSRLADAHTRALNTRSLYLESGVRLATLGFKTRKGIHEGLEVAEVVSVRPGVFSSGGESGVGVGADPIIKGDRVVRVDGRDVGDYVRSELLPYANTGDDEASLSLAYRFIFNRTNVLFPNFPRGVVRLEILRAGERIERSIPWVHMSTKEQRGGDDEETEGHVISEFRDDGSVVVERRDEPQVLSVGQGASAELAMQNFFSPFASFAADASEVASADDKPQGAQEVTIEGLKISLFQTAKGLVGIYRVNDFTLSRMHKCSTAYKNGKFQIQVCEPFTAKHYASAFAKLKTLGVKALVLDLRSNPGGVLKMGYELIKGLSSKSLPVNDSRVRITEEWMAGFRSLSQSDKIPKVEREGYRNAYETLQRDIEAKRRLSSPIHLMGTQYLFGAPNAWDGPLFVLIDELCASMCDIFAGFVQDHSLGKVLGKKSMGAGGSVGRGPLTPHTKISLSMTQSMIYRKDGSAIENVGVTPDSASAETQGKPFWEFVTRQVESGI